MNHQEDSFLFTNLKYIPQVSLLHVPKTMFKKAIDEFLKRIVCQKQFCLSDNLCNNCQKIKDSCYFDLMWYKFNQNNLMKKQDVSNIINTLSHQSLENTQPKICVIEAIEYTSLSAANVFLKFLENLPNNTFLIFVSSNFEKILGTISSRSQIFTCTNQKLAELKNDNFSENDFLIVENVLQQFITNINNKKFSNNFFLVKEIIELKENIELFFQFLLLLAEKKLIGTNDFSSNQTINKMFKNWKNSERIFLINLIESIIELINKFSNTKNINLSLLLNHFFIKLEQGQEHDWKN